MTNNTGALTRAAPLRASSWNAETYTFDLVLSAGTAVERRDQAGAFAEVLDIAGATWPDTIPLLDSHRQGSLDDNLGDVTNIRREGAEIVGTVRLSKHSPKAQRIAAELSDGRSFAASIGYAVNAWSETKPAGKRTLTAKSWRIMEASLVSIPADPSSKIRSIELTTSANTATRAETNAAIRAAAKAAALPAEWADAHIDAEADLATVNAEALAAIAARSAAAGTIRTVATVGTDHTDPDAIRGAMADALAHRLAPSAVKLEGRAVEYRGLTLLDMAGDMAVARGERVNLRSRDDLLSRAIGAHSTSDFPLLMAAAATKRCWRSMKLPPRHIGNGRPTSRLPISRRTRSCVSVTFRRSKRSRNPGRSNTGRFQKMPNPLPPRSTAPALLSAGARL